MTDLWETDLWDRYLSVRELLARTREELDHAKALNRDYEHKMQGVRETLNMIASAAYSSTATEAEKFRIADLAADILDAWGKPCC